MVARRDYADEWRDALATLAQVPVAGLLATNFFVEQWVQRTSRFAAHVGTRFALQRRAGRGATAGREDLTADVITEDLMAAARSFTRGLVSLPGEAATFFDRRVEEMVREVLERVQPDAGTDLAGYVRRELDEVSRDVERLRETVRTMAARDDAPGRRPRRNARVAGMERVLREIQRAVDTLAERNPRARPRPERRSSRAFAQRRMRAALAVQRVVDEIDRSLADIEGKP